MLKIVLHNILRFTRIISDLWGAHAPSRVVSGALAGNFFSYCYTPFWWHSTYVANDLGISRAVTIGIDLPRVGRYRPLATTQRNWPNATSNRKTAHIARQGSPDSANARAIGAGAARAGILPKPGRSHPSRTG